MVRVIEVGGEDVARLPLYDGSEMQIAIGEGQASAVLVGRTLVVSADDACSLSVALQALAEARMMAKTDAPQGREGEAADV